MDQTVLMIAWHFPPLNHTASKRTGCFAKYLASLGWKPIVLCVEWTKENCLYDESYVKNYGKDITIVQVPYHPPAMNSAMDIVRKKATSFAFSHLIPIEWYRAAKAAIERIVNQHKVSVIWASYPGLGGLPHTLADWASRKWNIPWVADYRDVPGQIGNIPIFHKVRLLLDAYREKKIMKSASEIVTVSAALKEKLEARHGKTVTVIENGFDSADYLDRKEIVEERKRIFRIVYAGNIYLPHRNPRPVLDAIGELIDSKELKEEEIALEFYGTDEAVIGKVFKGSAYVKLVKRYPRLSNEAIVENLRSATVLLQLAFGEDKGIATGKVYEYLAADRPILSVPQDHDCVDKLLSETQAGVSCTGTFAIRKQIGQWYREWKATGKIDLPRNAQEIGKYSRQEQAKRLAAILTRSI